MDFLRKSKLFYGLIIVTLVLAILGLSYNVRFILQPIGVLLGVIIFPITTTGFLYYILLPLVQFLNKRIKRKNISILIVFILMGFVFVGVTIFFASLITQIQSFITQIPNHLNSLSERLRFILTELNIDDVQIIESLDYINFTVLEFVAIVGISFLDIILLTTKSAVSIIVTAITIPIVLVYMFKDGHKLSESIVKLSPTKYAAHIKVILVDIDKTLSAFIGGQVIVCMYVGTSAFIIFSVLGVPYALFFASLAGIMDIVPYVGPWIGVAPAFVLAWLISPQTALILAIAIIIIQLLESYVVYPGVMGKNLHIHPVTIIFLLMFAGAIGGIAGMIVAMPLYSVIKSVLKNIALLRTQKVHQNEVVDEIGHI